MSELKPCQYECNECLHSNPCYCTVYGHPDKCLFSHSNALTEARWKNIEPEKQPDYKATVESIISYLKKEYTDLRNSDSYRLFCAKIANKIKELLNETD